MSEDNAVYLNFPTRKDAVLDPPLQETTLSKEVTVDIHTIQQALYSTDKYRRRIAEVGARHVAELLRKNADYGSSVFEPPTLTPEIGIVNAIEVRMSDKLKRLQNLKKPGQVQQVKDESIDDTYRDFANYCILREVAVLISKEKSPPEAASVSKEKSLPEAFLQQFGKDKQMLKEYLKSLHDEDVDKYILGMSESK